LASAGCSADAPACGQAVGANLAPANLDFGRARWMPGNAEWMNGKAKDLNECNTFFICDTVNADWDQRKILADLRLMGKKCCGRRARPSGNVEAERLTAGYFARSRRMDCNSLRRALSASG
jgi:hypothetical protein